MLPTLVRETGPAPRLSVIWLHGLGADGNDFVPVVPELQLPASLPVRFVFPTAPAMPVTINGGYVMPAWYDILSLDGDQRLVDEAGIRASRDAIRALIAAENARGMPCSRIVLAGFSQGGALAWLTGLTHDQPLAGLIALSTYQPLPALLAAELNPACLATPVFAAHGDADDVVPASMGMAAAEQARALGLDRLDWQTYPMGHAVCLPEILAIGRWLQTLA